MTSYSIGVWRNLFPYLSIGSLWELLSYEKTLASLEDEAWKLRGKYLNLATKSVEDRRLGCFLQGDRWGQIVYLSSKGTLNNLTPDYAKISTATSTRLTLIHEGGRKVTHWVSRPGGSPKRVSTTTFDHRVYSSDFYLESSSGEVKYYAYLTWKGLWMKTTSSGAPSLKLPHSSLRKIQVLSENYVRFTLETGESRDYDLRTTSHIIPTEVLGRSPRANLTHLTTDGRLLREESTTMVLDRGIVASSRDPRTGLLSWMNLKGEIMREEGPKEDRFCGKALDFTHNGSQMVVTVKWGSLPSEKESKGIHKKSLKINRPPKKEIVDTFCLPQKMIESIENQCGEGVLTEKEPFISQ